MPGFFAGCALTLRYNVVVSNRTLLVLVANAISWGVLLQWPWQQILGPAVVALAVIHLGYPFVVPRRTLPLVVAGVDAAAIYAAYLRDAWGELTVVIVPLLGVAAIIALAYAATVVLLLQRRAVRRELARRDAGPGERGD